MIEDWQEFRDQCTHLPREDRWIFRGQRCSQWVLKTSLERTLDRVKSHFETPRKTEEFLIREFKRHYHRYSHYLPDDDDTLEWLALMQHHGAPTRLVDWTFSEYVALFFAIDGAAEGSICSVWAVNQTKCWNKFKEALPCDLQTKIQANDKDLTYLNHVLHKGLSTPAICPLNPFRLNERLAVQRGTFLVPSDPDLPFQEIFDQFIGLDNPLAKKIDIHCTRQFLLQSWAEVHRMNISNVTLFPGVDGLARSLNTSALLRHIRPQS